MKPLNSGHLRVLKHLHVIDRCPLMRGNLKNIVTFGSKCFVRKLFGMPAIRRFNCIKKLFFLKKIFIAAWKSVVLSWHTISQKNLELFYLFASFLFTASESEPDYYHRKLNGQVVLQVTERLRMLGNEVILGNLNIECRHEIIKLFISTETAYFELNEIKSKHFSKKSHKFTKNGFRIAVTWKTKT